MRTVPVPGVLHDAVDLVALGHPAEDAPRLFGGGHEAIRVAGAAFRELDGHVASRHAPRGLDDLEHAVAEAVAVAEGCTSLSEDGGGNTSAGAAVVTVAEGCWASGAWADVGASDAGKGCTELTGAAAVLG